ncbi:uncharacterized protein LOC143589440 [Bidens hawaiensis]|uniref:uncharacterized protein LOC143589440 n=1 Tax=Bidens hawaiensis TaxID=980011 RepID=UPI00404ABFE7
MHTHLKETVSERVQEMDPTSTSVSVEIEPAMLSNMPSEPVASTSLPPPPNLPRGDLLGNREQYRRICIPLYEASVKGYSITENGDTALHIFASAISTKLKLMEDFVRKLVSKMNSEDILLQNRRGNTALCLAAARGNVSIAEIIVGSNHDVLNIPGNKGMLPLYIASFYQKYEMVKYLYEESNNMSGEVWTHRNRVWVLLRCVEADFFDIALKIVTGRPELATSGEILRVLARKTDAFREIKPHFIWRVISRIIHRKVAHVENEGDVMKLLRFIWTYIMENLDKPHISNIIGRSANNELQEYEPTTSHVHPRSQSSHVLFIAAKMGNSKFIVELIRQYPDLIWKLNDSNQSIFHVAVSHRQVGVYNLMYQIGWIKDLITTQVDMDGNGMLHLAAKSAKKKRLQEISGVALQMHRELL